MRDLKEITYKIDDYNITTNIEFLRSDGKGWYKENGYIMRKVNNHPKQNKRGYVAEHRLVYEQYLGRFLDSKEVIHHINGNREDNRIENLQLSVRNSEHIKKYHSKSRNSNGQFICKNPIFNEIKFRLFDKDRKITLIFTLQKLISTTFRRSKFEFRGRFTGLKDKNGVEIYEGDIVELDEEGRCLFGCTRKYQLVGFRDGAFMTGRNNSYEIMNTFLWILKEYITVVGNKFDNLELLEE